MFSAPQSHSINMFSEDFIAGYMHDGRMSVVRRFFCLFVTFDLVFISLLWVICIVIKGANIKESLENEIIHYDIQKSLFDIVALASSRFLILILFYALCYVSHWFIIAVSTSCSCAFLIYKVFVFDVSENFRKYFVNRNLSSFSFFAVAINSTASVSSAHYYYFVRDSLG